jgi:MFS family permease
MIGSVALFVLGSGISGGAINSPMMIAGRSIQGIGGGGINVMIDMIVSDMLPLRERGNFMGMIFAVFAVGTSLGPFIGGVIVQHSSWRWVVSI